MKKKTLAFLVTTACFTQTYAADNTLAPITVSASREDRALNDLASNAAVIGKKEITSQQAQTLGDTLQMIPGVDMDGYGRYGESDVTIRGVSGNRVKLTVDGLPIADQFSFGPYQDAGRVYFDTSNLNQVEIIRGPISSLHGASAVGGVVSLVTRNPSDVIKADKNFGGDVTAEYLGKDNAKRVGATGAFKTDRGVSGLLNYSYTHHNETKNHGGADVIGKKRGVPDPLDANVHSLSGKVIYDADENNTFTFNASLFHDDQDSDILSKYGPNFLSPPRGEQKLPLFSDRKNQSVDDWQERKAFSITHDFALDTSFADSGYWRAYAQQQETEQKTKITDSEPFPFMGRVPPNLSLHHDLFDNRFRTRDMGIDLQMDKAFDLASVSQELLYGASYNHRAVSMQQHKTTTFDNGKPKIDELSKNGPDTTINSLGVFAQDRITFGESGISLIPGVRYDYYSLEPKEDPTYRKTVGEKFKTRSYQTHHISPRLGLLYTLNDLNTLYANYSEGFRAPAFNETNLGFANYQRGYSLVANPDLNPESSRGIELGWRFNNGSWKNTLTGYYNQYKNFIFLDTASAKRNPTTGLTEFQYKNADSTEIYGVEWSSNWEVIDGLNLQTSLAYSKGKEKNTGKPLNQIDPFNGLVAVNYDAPEQRWGAGATFKASAGKHKKDINSGNNPRTEIFPSGGYGVLDLTGYYRPIEDLTVRAGLYNVFDKKYTSWSNAQSLSEEDRNTFSNPGRWFGTSIKYEF